MRKLLVAVALLVASTGVARAQSGVHTHDGFFLQLDLGGGRFSNEADDPTFGDLKLSGTGAQFGVAVGAAVSENLIIAGHLWGVSAVDPDAELDGQDMGDFPGSVGLSAIGVNFTYYIMPVNVYLSATPSLTTQTVDPDDGDEGETENGFGMRLAVGKEWWVSDNWALGLNAQFAFSSNEDQGTDPATVKARWFGLAFSATYD